MSNSEHVRPTLVQVNVVGRGDFVATRVDEGNPSSRSAWMSQQQTGVVVGFMFMVRFVFGLDRGGGHGGMQG